MILSVAIVTGFKSEIKNKVIGFAAHIQISNLDNNSTFETKPIQSNFPEYFQLTNIPEIIHIQPFASKPGIIKTTESLQGIILRGVDKKFDWQFFNEYMVDGQNFYVNDTSKVDDIILSKYLSDLLKLKIGDNVYMHFVQEPPRMRKFKLRGIYKTGMVEFDRFIVLCDIKHAQKLNNWNNTQISGYDIFLANSFDLQNTVNKIRELISNRPNSKGNMMLVEGITERFPIIFDWLELIDVNVKLILILMLIVAGFNMASGLLVLILENTNFIGVLKALGTSNWVIQKIFLHQAVYIILRGMMWGNIIALIFIFLQTYWKIIPLNPDMYFIDNVPVDLRLWHWVALNIGTFVLTVLIMIIPSYLITRISPIKAIRFN